MNESDRAAYRQRYVARLNEYGHDERTLGWAAGKQHERFAALTSFVPFTGLASILDVGCGFGDLYRFLQGHGFTGRYTGIDFIPELIEVGKRTYPQADLRVADLAELSAGEKFDLVVASGIFNARLEDEDNWAHTTATLKAMFALCHVAVAADFLTSYVDFERPDLFYTSPEKAFAFAKQLTRRVALAHHYMPFEFAICLYRNDQILDGARFHDLRDSPRP